MTSTLLFFVALDRAHDTKTDEIVALKKVRMDKERDGKLEIPKRIPNDLFNVAVSIIHLF